MWVTTNSTKKWFEHIKHLFFSLEMRNLEMDSCWHWFRNPRVLGLKQLLISWPWGAPVAETVHPQEERKREQKPRIMDASITRKMSIPPLYSGKWVLVREWAHGQDFYSSVDCTHPSSFIFKWFYFFMCNLLILLGELYNFITQIIW